jgi:D-glycero-alpha-D-manno-heptose 1-phosphate guanylyltransferase
MQFIILAGGFGTRLKSIIGDTIPKPMADINGKPFLEILIENIISQSVSVSRIILSTGYKHEVIFNYFGNSYKNIPIRYIQEFEPLGTGGALLYSINSMDIKEPFFLLNGDTFIQFDVNKIIEKLDLPIDGVIVTRKVDDISRYGGIEIQSDNMITKIIEKGSSGSGIINSGVYLLKPDAILESIKKIKLTKSFSFEVDLMPYLFENYKYRAFEVENYFIDIGVPDDYKRFCDQMKS